MKKRKNILNRWPALFAVVFLIPGGCDNKPETEGPSRDAEVTADAVITGGSSGYEWAWEEGELVSVYTTGASVNRNVPFDFTSVSASGTSGTLSGNIRQTATGAHTFSAAYPYSESAASDPSKYVVTVPASQNITTGGIDPSTFVLVGTPVEKSIPATGGVSLGEMAFSSPLAIVRLAFTNAHPYISEAETVTSVRFATGADIRGQAYCDLTAAGSAANVFSGSTAIDLFYPENAGPTADDGFDAWMTSFPFSILSGDDYTITITTDLQTLKATLAAPSMIRFEAGAVTALPVTIDSRFQSDIPLEEQWGRVDDTDAVTAGQYVIASYYSSSDKWYALPNAITEGSANPAAVEIAVANDNTMLADDPANTLVWNFTGSNTAGFTVSGSGPSYLTATDSSTGLSVVSSQPSDKWKFTSDATYGLMMKYGSLSQNVYLYMTTPDWRFYSAGTWWSTKLSLFKKGATAVPGATVTTASVSDVTMTGATLGGSYTHPSAQAESAGFVYGTSSASLNNEKAAVISGSSFSATLSGLPKGTQYYYRAFVEIGGKRYLGAVRNFRTALPGPVGKPWIELPDKISGSGLLAKTYYATYEKPVNGVRGRNYSVLYDASKKLALWVAFPMNASTHLGDYKRADLEKWSYDNDGDIPTSGQPAIVNGSYRDSNYDRGHQIASADRNGALEAGRQTFFVTNMTPQYSTLNQVTWGNLEDAIRNDVALAQTTPAQDTLYIVTGPLMPAVQVKYVNDRDDAPCPVPDGYFKVILWSKYSSGARKYDSVGFIFDNRSYSGTGYAAQAVPVSSVEQRAGLTFFGNLDVSSTQMTAIKGTGTWDSFKNRNTNPY